MRIKSISIRNYRQYKSFDFNFLKTQGIKNDLNIIIAQNGTGKSNFLNAITWCLYGEETHLQDGDSNKGLPIVNYETIQKTAEKEKIVLKVELIVEVEGENEIITREKVFVKNSNVSGLIKDIKTEIKVTKKIYDQSFGTKSLGNILDKDAENYIQKLFPKGISQYFFFDNEQMNNYFKANSGKAIKDSINEITKVSVVQSVVERLKNVETDCKVNLASGDEKIEQLRNDADMIANLLDSVKKDAADNAIQIEKGETELKELNEKIKGADNLKLLEKNRNTFETLKQKLVEEQKNNNIELENFIVRYMMLLNIYPALEATLKLIDQKDKDRQLPPDFSIEVMKKTIDKCRCELCENNLDEQHTKIVLDKLHRFNVSSPIFELLLTIKNNINSLKKEAENYENKKMELLNRIKNNEEELHQCENSILEIIKEMKNIPNKDEIRDSIDKREDVIRNLDILKTRKGSLEEQEKNCVSKLNKVNEDFDKAVHMQNKNKDKAFSYEKAKELREILQAVEKEIVEEIREKISIKTYENFCNFIWKTNTYGSVVIHDDYTVDLIHKNGYSSIGSTSAAERALLALAFTNAMHEVSGFEYPLVIDSPVGRVSDINRRKFAETLEKISEEKQIIMLFTPDEYSTDISNVFDSIARISEFKMNSDESETEMVGN